MGLSGGRTELGRGRQAQPDRPRATATQRASGAAEAAARRRLRGLVDDPRGPADGRGHAAHVLVLGRDGGEAPADEAEADVHLELADLDALPSLLDVLAITRHDPQAEGRVSAKTA